MSEEGRPTRAEYPDRPLGPHVVGQRVVVRRVVRGETGPSGGPALTDVLGTCESWPASRDGEVVVRRERGDRVAIPLADVVAGKPVPPRPSVHHRLDPAEADRRAAPGWPAVESEPLGGWLLRASSGYTNRANSVLALGPAPDDAARRVEAWYADRSLPAQAHVLPGSEAAATLRGAGWTAYEHTLLMLASPSKVRRRLEAPDADVEVATSLDAGWLATDDRTARQPDVARAVLERRTGQQGAWFATVREGGEVVARGRGVVHDDWLGLASLWTAPSSRGRGLGRAVVAALLREGAELGVTTAYLQVVEANTAARALYERLGFAEHHRYDYLRAPGR